MSIFGWGMLGRLNKGGWIVIEQADVGEGQWRIVHFQMEMSGRVLFKTRSFDTTEEETQFVPVPVGMTLSAGDSDAAIGAGRSDSSGEIVRCGVRIAADRSSS